MEIKSIADNSKVATHRFTLDEGDWGFTRFAELQRIFHKDEEHERPMVEDERANITAYVRIYKDPTGVLWRSEEHTSELQSP